MGRIFTLGSAFYSADGRIALDPVTLRSYTGASFSGLSKTSTYKEQSGSFNLSDVALYYMEMAGGSQDSWPVTMNDAPGSVLYKFPNNKYYATQCHLVWGTTDSSLPNAANYYVPDQTCYISGTAILDKGDGTTGYLVDYWPLWVVLCYQAARVSFDANGGSGSPTSKIVSYADAVSASSAVSKTGYTFAGWNTAADGSGTSVADDTAIGSLVDSADVNGDITLYAQWTVNQYTATFDANGGTGGIAKTQDYGSALTAPTVTRTGYTFAGWSPTVPSTMPAESKIYVAQWTANTYNISYDLDGGVPSDPLTTTATYDTWWGSAAPIATGCVFLGWMVSDYDTTTAVYSIGADVWDWLVNTGNPAYPPVRASDGWVSFFNLTPVNGGTVVLKARWQLATYVVTLDGQGATTAGTTEVEATYKSAMPTPITLPARTGYTFAGYYDATSGGAKYYNADGTSAKTWDKAESATLYARWTANTYTVTFDANTGSVSPAAKTVTYDAAYGELPTATKTGYIFAGWWTAASGGSQVTSATTVKITAAQTLYAHWTTQQYTVTFDANGGNTPSPASKTVYYNEPYGVLATATKTGYTFAGWWTAASGGSEVTAASTVTITADQTLYAHWTANSYNINYVLSGGTPGAVAPTTIAYDFWQGIAPPTKNGYTFAGWSVSNYDATTALYSIAANTFDWLVNAGNPATPPTDESKWTAFYNLTPTNGGTVTLTARWQANTYRLAIDYENYGGSSPVEQDILLTFGSNAWCWVGVKVRTGYALTGYFTAASGGTKVWDENGYAVDGVYWRGSGDTAAWQFEVTNEPFTVYAQWTANTYTVTFDTQAAGITTNGKTVTYDSTYGALPTLQRTGYVFLGWYTAATGGTEVTSATTVAITDDQTLYAHWRKNKYTIAYADVEGSYAGAPTEGEYGEAVAVPLPAKDHYVFDYWTVSGFQSSAVWGTTSDPSEQVTVGGQVAGYSQSVAYLYFKDLRTDDGGTVTLSAHWRRKTYTVDVTAGDAGWSVAAIEQDGTATRTITDARFYAKAGASYTMRLTFADAAARRLTWKVPYEMRMRPSGTSGTGEQLALSRVAGNVGEPAVFASAARTFGDDEEAAAYEIYATNSHTVTVTLAASAGYDFDAGEDLTPTMAFANGTTTQVKATAKETNRSALAAWSGGTASGVAVTVPASGDLADDAALTATYQLQREAVTAAFEAGSAQIANAGDARRVKVTQTVSGTTSEVQTVGYGQSATWRFDAGAIGTGASELSPMDTTRYRFAGWYDGNGRLQSASAEYTATSVTAPIVLYARLEAKVEINYEIEAGVSGVSGAVAIDGETALARPYSKWVPAGHTVTLTATPGADSYFGGWWTGTVGNLGERKPWTAEQPGVTIVDAAQYCAVFRSTAEVYFVAIYARDIGTSATEFGAYGKFEVAGLESASSGITEITKAEFETGVGAGLGKDEARASASDYGACYLKIEGVQRLSVAISEMATDPLTFARVLSGLIPGGAETQISEQAAFVALINNNFEFIADFGEVPMNTLTVNSRDIAGGTVKVGNLAVNLDGEPDGSAASGDFETGKPATAIAMPENGYRFAGWYSTDDFEGEPVSAEPVYAFTITADTTLYANFVASNKALYKWEGLSTYKRLTWKSKVYTLSKPANLTSVRVDATTLNEAQPAYPIARFKYEAFSSPQAGATASGTVDFNSANTRLADDRMRRLPARRPERYFQVEIECVGEVDAITIGTSGEGLAQ